MKKILFAAVAALFMFTSCNKDVNTNEPTTGETQSVYVKISSGVNSKAVGNAVGATRPAKFNNGFLVFTGNSGMISKVVGIPAQVTVAELEAGHSITGVPDYSNEVYVFANVPSGLSIPSTGNISAVRALVATVNSQVDLTTPVDNIALYGTSSITSGAASITVAPIAARIEIPAFNLAPGSAITSYRVEGIFINRYYPNSTLDGKISGANVNNGDLAAGYIGNAAPYVAGFPLFDYNTSGIGQLTSTTYAPATAGNVWYYNVMAPSDATVAPTIIVRLTNIVATGITLADPQFLTIKLNDGTSTITKLEAGKAYNFGLTNLAFDETNLTPNPEVNTMDITCNISIIDWSTVTVTPEM